MRGNFKSALCCSFTLDEYESYKLPSIPKANEPMIVATIPGGVALAAAAAILLIPRTLLPAVDAGPIILDAYDAADATDLPTEPVATLRPSCEAIALCQAVCVAPGNEFTSMLPALYVPYAVPAPTAEFNAAPATGAKLLYISSDIVIDAKDNEAGAYAE